jgi:hypothetical protein
MYRGLKNHDTSRTQVPPELPQPRARPLHQRRRAAGLPGRRADVPVGRALRRGLLLFGDGAGLQQREGPPRGGFIHRHARVLGGPGLRVWGPAPAAHPCRPRGLAPAPRSARRPGPPAGRAAARSPFPDPSTPPRPPRPPRPRRRRAWCRASRWRWPPSCAATCSSCRRSCARCGAAGEGRRAMRILLPRKHWQALGGSLAGAHTPTPPKPVCLSGRPGRLLPFPARRPPACLIGARSRR